jgi:phage tail-like protein
MKLIPDSGVRVLQGQAQWRLGLLQQTVLVGEVVMLQSSDPVTPAPSGGVDFTGGFAGMAFDKHCRLFHAQPELAKLEFVLWGRTDNLGVHDLTAHPFDVTGSEQVASKALPKQPLALACDTADFLYVADPDDSAVWLIDVWQQEVARRIALPAKPLDLTASEGAIYVLLDDGSTWQLAPCDSPERTAWPAVPGAQRLAVGAKVKGRPLAWLLLAPGRSTATAHALHDGSVLPAPFATDLLIEATATLEAGHVLVLAQRPGEEFRRLQLGQGAPVALVGLVAPHYDGRGIEAAPDGRVAYWTAQGLRHAAPARGRYLQTGQVFATALDGEHDQSRWGRITVEACLPEGTQIQFWAFTADEVEVIDPVSPTPAAPPDVAPTVSQHVWATTEQLPQRLFRDPSQRPLSPTPAEGFALYDAPIMAPPGRYLWLVFELTGTRSKSPRLRSARVEFPGHGLLQQLPRTLWREPAAREFLFRFLMPLSAMLDEWENVSTTRQRLLDARISPAVALPWLAQFVGLVLDPCWPEAVQRRLILEAAALFRTRGTLGSLQRMLELLTDAQVIIIENFRLRGGGVVGNPESVVSQAVLGVGYRVGGQIGEADPGVIADATPPDFDDFAHRFTVTIVAVLTAQQLACARRLIEAHKPAHTDFTLCTAETGLRAGVGSAVGISSVIGKSGGFEPAILGDAALNAGFLLGRPALEVTS